MSQLLNFTNFIKESADFHVEVEEQLFVIDGRLFCGSFRTTISADFNRDDEENGYIGGWEPQSLEVSSIEYLVVYTSTELVKEIRNFINLHYYDWIKIMPRDTTYVKGTDKTYRIQKAFVSAIWQIIDKYPDNIEITDRIEFNKVRNSINGILERDQPDQNSNNFEPTNQFTKVAYKLVDWSDGDTD